MGCHTVLLLLLICPEYSTKICIVKQDYIPILPKLSNVPPARENDADKPVFESDDSSLGVPSSPHGSEYQHYE